VQIFSRQEDFFAAGENCPKNANRLIRADTLDFIEKAAGKKLRWDIIVLDPPAFSNSKKMTGNFDLERDITELLKRCCFLLAPEGKIFLSVNTRSSGITAAQLGTELSSCARNVKITDLSRRTVDEDFKGKKTPKTFLICR
jgi:23S rRNA G2069 N7-methylase RlmK/C1962 C5-methylase RlmI